MHQIHFVRRSKPSNLLLFLFIFHASTSARAETKPEEETFVVTRSVPYATVESTSTEKEAKSFVLLADLYVPKGDGPFPTLLMVHGGAWFSGNKAHVALHARTAADAGYAVVAINYRLAPRHKFPAQVDDLRAALRFIKANAEKYHFDTERIGAYGYSAGAHLVALLGMTQNEAEENRVPGAEVKVVVAGGSPCEFSWIAADSKRLSFWLGGSREERPDVYAAASPTTFVDASDPPTFLFHGESDGIVPIESARELSKLLKQKKVQTAFHTVPKASHLGAFVNPVARAKAISFLNARLKKPDETKGVQAINTISDAAKTKAAHP